MALEHLQPLNDALHTASDQLHFLVRKAAVVPVIFGQGHSMTGGGEMSVRGYSSILLLSAFASHSTVNPSPGFKDAVTQPLGTK
jgi:hypothetical protein